MIEFERADRLVLGSFEGEAADARVEIVLQELIQSSLVIW